MCWCKKNEKSQVCSGIAKALIDILKVLSEYEIRSCDCRHPCVSALPFLHCAQHRQRWRHCDKCRNWFIFLFSMSSFFIVYGKVCIRIFLNAEKELAGSYEAWWQQQLERRVRAAQTCARSTFILLLPTLILKYHCMTTMKGIHNTKMNVNTNPNIGQIANPKPILMNESD